MTTDRTIERGVVYPLQEFKERMGLKHHSWLAAKHNGCPTIKVGKRVYIDGDAAIDWLRSLAK